jgi:tyrosyl-tRNA synthetase
VTSTDERLALIERNAAEVLGRDELRGLLDSGLPLRHYIGFEISGKAHLGTGLVSMAKVSDFMRAGVHCSVLLADWHTWINDKLGGDRDLIRRVASGYFTEALRASLMCLGADPSAVEFVLASDLYRHNDEYWATVIDVSKHTTLSRMQRSISILGRQEGESVDFAKLIYPAMQAADIFAQQINIAHAGIDQRKAHVIARDVALQIRINALHDAQGKQIKPVAVHHPLLLGLRRPPVWPVPEETARDVYADMKMSKSDANSAVFVHDSPDEIRDKVRRAFCPPGSADFNPVLDWVDKLAYRIAGGPFTVARNERNGGDVSFENYEAVVTAYTTGSLHPMDLKAALSERLIDFLEPARKHFEKPEVRAMLTELESVDSR